MSIWPEDIFGRPLSEGDYVAVGMAYNRSSVLRVGRVVAIKQTADKYSHEPTGRFSIRIEWRNDGDRENKYSWRSVKDSNILYDHSYRLGKFIIVDKELVEQYPPDIKGFDE